MVANNSFVDFKFGDGVLQLKSPSSKLVVFVSEQAVDIIYSNCVKKSKSFGDGRLFQGPTFYGL